MLVETVLDSPEKSDYVQLANESATAAMKKAWQLDRAMEEQRIYKPEPGSLEKYTGGSFFERLTFHFFLNLRC